jgi:peptide deformylase
MRLPLRYYGDPVLRERAAPVAAVDDELLRLSQDLIETMRLEQGVGLAAQQIGKTVALCVVEVPPDYDTDPEGRRLNPDVPMPLVLFNPRVIASSTTLAKGEEGCLSFPGIRAAILRPTCVTVTFLDREGRAAELRLRDFVARVVQHEIDHLNGVLFTDRMSQVKRVALAGQLKRMKRETLEKMSVA